MLRNRRVLAPLVVVALVAAIAVLTRIDIGGGGDGGLPAGSGLVAFLGGGGTPGGEAALDIDGSPTCGAFYAARPTRRGALISPMARALQETGAAVDDGRLLRAVTLSCQAVDPATRVDRALGALYGADTAGADPIGDLCEAYSRDAEEIVGLARESAPVLIGIEGATSDGDLPGVYRELLGLSQATRSAIERVEAAEPETHAGRLSARYVTVTLRQFSEAHSGWLGGARTLEEWLDGPSERAPELYFAEIDRVTEGLQRRAADPDLEPPFPAEYDCGATP